MSSRREFITLLGGAATWPLAARAQQAAKLPIVGFLGTDASGWRPWTSAFVQRLHELGWIEGRTIAIESAFRIIARSEFGSTAVRARPRWRRSPRVGGGIGSSKAR
jgi:hypothetical protein